MSDTRRVDVSGVVRVKCLAETQDHYDVVATKQARSTSHVLSLDISTLMLHHRIEIYGESGLVFVGFCNLLSWLMTCSKESLAVAWKQVHSRKTVIRSCRSLSSTLTSSKLPVPITLCDNACHFPVHAF